LESGADWERYEGMRVSAALMRAVSGTSGTVQESTNTATSTGVFYAMLPRQPRPYRTPDESEQFERLRIDTRAQGGSALEVPAGTSVYNASGPLDYVSGTYGIAQEATVPLRVQPGPLRGSAIASAGVPEFALASMNLQRLFDDQDDPGSDVVVQTAAFQGRVERFGRLIREALGSPDVIGIQEAENIDVLRALARAACDYDAHLLDGNDPGGIDVGVLVKRGRVEVLNVEQVGKNATLQGGGVLWDRPPLAARLRVDGVRFTIVVVHLRSLIGEGSATVDAKRAAQSEALGQLVRTRIAAGEDVVVLGDFNTFAFDRLMIPIRADSLLNLTDTLPPSDSYTYVHEGVTQALDHILISPGMRSRLSSYGIRHVNADYPEVWRKLGG
jgi:predicted extracellular nuclease